MPSSNQQLYNEPEKNWCGGYLTIDNSISFSDPTIRKVRISDRYLTSIRDYSVPTGTSSYDVPETLHTGEAYKLTFRVYPGLSGFPTTEEWTLEMKRPDGSVAKKALFETEGVGWVDVGVNLYTPECVTYTVSIRPRSILD